ncbi:transmembrane protein 100-like [Gadus macrocephalus]|uniref:transmembrane protein 100-like n=1 Tax=Gadus macrocephalus TaxID=80720 RepID=UPI0028CB19B3|nr:transmembrane protein 100-like [Gadus macrocephalus]
MAHLFLASTIPVSGEDPHTSKGAPKPPKSSMKTPTLSTAPVDSKTTTTTTTATATPSKKDTRKVIVTTVPLINELQLTAATGGAEMSCYRCTIPFGVVVLIAGVVVTAVAYAFNSHGSTISVLGLVLLSAGLGLLGSSAVCWRLRRRKKSRDKRRESTTALMFNHDALLA